MCFTEFIGYTCGHTSLEVLRPCPLTTQFHTNPICSTYGRRSILAQEMCPACQRILHGRAVLILEWEHHWMHERGVCGCPVVFPDLIQPRVIVPSRQFEASQPSMRFASGANDHFETDRHTKDRTTELNLSNKPVTKKGRGSKRKKKAASPQGPLHLNGQNKMTDSSADQPGEKQLIVSKTRRAVSEKSGEKQRGESKCSSSSSESNPDQSQSDGTGGQNMSAVVSARNHSLYGAEWIDEHRQLHNAGSCNCAADFSFYQTPKAYGNLEPSFYASSCQEQDVPMAGFYRSTGQNFESQQRNFEEYEDLGSFENNISLRGSHFSGPSYGFYDQQQSHDGINQGAFVKSVSGQDLRDGCTRTWEQNDNNSRCQSQASCTALSPGRQPDQQSQAYQGCQPQQPWFPTEQFTDIHQGAQPGAWSTAQQVNISSRGLSTTTKSSVCLYWFLLRN